MWHPGEPARIPLFLKRQNECAATEEPYKERWGHLEDFWNPFGPQGGRVFIFSETTSEMPSEYHYNMGCIGMEAISRQDPKYFF